MAFRIRLRLRCNNDVSFQAVLKCGAVKKYLTFTVKALVHLFSARP
jgi:hypothetical protein